MKHSVIYASQKLIHDLSSPSCVSHRTSLLHVSPGDAIAKAPRLLGPTATMQRRHIFGRREKCNLQKLVIDIQIFIDDVYVVGLCSKFYSRNLDLLIKSLILPNRFFRFKLQSLQNDDCKNVLLQSLDMCNKGCGRSLCDNEQMHSYLDLSSH